MRLSIRPFASLCACFSAFTLAASAQTGPLVGTVKNTEAWLLYRPGDAAKPLRLSVLDAAKNVVATSEATGDAAGDFVAHFHVAGLKPSTEYTYRIEDLSGSQPVLLAGPEDGLRFKTRMTPNTRGQVTAAFMSCANATAEPVWERILALKPDQLVFGGDTPYVDTADPVAIRSKHRAFLETPFLSQLIRGTSTVGTWDDHDFGLNNGNGVNCADRRDATRSTFVAYRAHDQYGNGSQALYHKVDLGPMEIFLLDPRWYSQTQPSPVDPTQKTAFGAEQLEWLRNALKASRAPFKVLLIGEVWQDKKNTENDDMFTYWYERDMILDYIRDQKIAGVVLVGGDIHVSRHLIHRQRLGYDLHDFVTSPAHTSVIPSLDVAHPDLEWSSQQPRQFITLAADTRVNPPVLTGKFYLADGTLQREVAIPYDQLAPKEGTGLGRRLRAWWSFDGDLKNQSVQGARLDAEAVNGASLVADGGLRGGAASFTRSSSQYLLVKRGALDDNTAAYTASMWCKPATLPAHGSSERAFIAESTLGGAVGGSAGFGISVGLRAAGSADKVTVELFTNTLQPAGAASTAAPTPISQGGFSIEVDRSLLLGHWSHLAVTFDSSRLRLFLNGTPAGEFPLPTPGPVSEIGGLVIGGHRDGTGRNFDGLIDEVALWNRVLADAEIQSLHNQGAATALPTATAAADSDGDSLEDWWENLYQLDAGNRNDALADNDGDGVPAWMERQLGTDPNFDDLSDLRRFIAPDSPAFSFRNPATGELSIHLTGDASTDLLNWSVLPTAAGSILGDEILIQLQSDLSSQFFRFGTQPAR